jgi:hypothetical protein
MGGSAVARVVFSRVAVSAQFVHTGILSRRGVKNKYRNPLTFGSTCAAVYPLGGNAEPTPKGGPVFGLGGDEQFAIGLARVVKREHDFQTACLIHGNQTGQSLNGCHVLIDTHVLKHARVMGACHDVNIDQ